MITANHGIRVAVLAAVLCVLLPGCTARETDSSLDAASMKPAMLSAGKTVGPADLRPFLTNGWSSDEPFGVWSIGEDSGLLVRIEKSATAGNQLFLQAGGLWAPQRQSMEVSARVNGGNWQHQTLTAAAPEQQHISVALPTLAAGDEVRVELHYDHPASPVELGLSSDTRALGISLRSLQLSGRTP
ncbi:hypothetical protein XpopCFBP1817_04635 [Xanthomonas populi]|uniref:Uncharacterized protein n=2 Tax=Xanthomonas populi TaxID=53414 RepID=A0A2S7EXG0_9XANT|nr:hypothetical protein XpopCFBP1817_04635 [Xanthomonas populi]